MRKQIHGWGRYPVMEAEVVRPGSPAGIRELTLSPGPCIARGEGRSYGDSALAPRVIDTRALNRFLSFNKETGELRCEAGVTLAEILDVFFNRGWFLPVTPGTRHVTVGGAIASDVHGKNHYREGCFSDHVTGFSLLGPNGEIHRCSRETNPELFHATCGGMGLTGIILEATFKLAPVQSTRYEVEITKAGTLEEVFALFEEYRDWPYTVAWVDGSRGRSHLVAGKNTHNGRFEYTSPGKLRIPAGLPGGLLNNFTASLFNRLYYNRFRGTKKSTEMDAGSFFYPLDAINDWNKAYGRKGFLQYQFVLPKKRSFEGIQKIFGIISGSGPRPYLSVLKLLGAENNNYLSFPMEGYTLSLDFKVDGEVFDLLDELDRVVADYGGRVYLTKDARMKPGVFEAGYPEAGLFREIREKYGMKGVFESEQSKRLEI